MIRYAKILTNTYVSATLWFGLSLLAAVQQVINHNYNNYLVYKYTFINLISRTNLYLPRPNLFEGIDHYGPVFALVMAPFTLLPDAMSIILWVILNAGLLYYAIQQLPLSANLRNLIVLLCAIELMTASSIVQFNPVMAALTVLSFVLVRKQQDIWGTLLIVLGAYIKLYSVIGVVFFLFSSHKIKFIGGMLLWGLVLFVLPMLFSSPAFIVQAYYDWFSSIKDYRVLHTLPTLQNVSVMSLIRNFFDYQQLQTSVVLTIASVLFVLPFFKIHSYRSLRFELLMLASVLIVTVIFSTRSTSTSYITAFVGMAVWFVTLPAPVSRPDVGLMIFALVLTSVLASGWFPQSFLALNGFKVLPCVLIWIKILYGAITMQRTGTDKALSDIA